MLKGKRSLEATDDCASAETKRLRPGCIIITRNPQHEWWVSYRSQVLRGAIVPEGDLEDELKQCELQVNLG